MESETPGGNRTLSRAVVFGHWKRDVDHAGTVEAVRDVRYGIWETENLNLSRDQIQELYEMIDRKTIKGYRISGIFKNTEIVTYNGNKYRINRAQKRKMDELAKSHHFPWVKLA